MPKENTLLAKRGTVIAKRPDPARGILLAQRNVMWLNAVIDAARTAAERSNQLGIFGTSISGTWLFSALKEYVTFFVDEDKTRIGQTLEGRPIVAPTDAPKGADVLVPLIPVVAERVIHRLAPLGMGLIAPPAFPLSRQ